MKQPSPRPRGFTLIELLVVIAIIGMLSAVILVSLMSARTKSQVAAGQAQDMSINHAIGDSLVGEWKFSEPSGSTAYDTSGNGFDGTLTGSVSRVTGINGPALQFGGGYVSIPYQAGENIVGGITITAWINASDITRTQGLVWKGSSTSYAEYGIGLWSSRLYAQMGSGWNASTQTLLSNTWYFVAISHPAGGVGTYYINGVAAGRDTGAAMDAVSGTNPISIGTYYTFGGMIDDVRIYSHSLSALALQKVYADGYAAHSVAIR